MRQKGKMNKHQLSQILAKRVAISLSESRKVLDFMSGLIEQALALRQEVSLSNFGTFYIYKTKSRTIPNPKKADQKIITLGSNVPKFRPSLLLKKKIGTIVAKKNSDSNVVKNNIMPPQNIQNPVVLPPVPQKIESKAPPSYSDKEKQILAVSAKSVKVPYISLKDKVIPKNILAKIPENIARTYQIVPVEEKNHKLVVAMVNPEDMEATEFAKKKTGMELSLRLTSASELDSVLDQYSGLAQEIKHVVEAVEKPEEKIVKTKPGIPAIAIEAPIARLVNSLLARATKDKASDIHIEPQEKELEVRFRIDGVLQKAVTLPKEMQASIIARIKIMSNLKTDETRVPQDGRFSIVLDKREVDFRISTLPTVYGEKIVMRILDKSKGIITLKDLGLTANPFKILNENIHKAHGMILVTGPTGCGKTTTQYAVIDEIYDVGVNIVTLEDPVEYKIPGINQSQVNPNVNYNFANGLRSIVRQDPDVIMLGEIRDKETASMAIHAALTGHVVLSTLHTNDAAGAIPRLIDMGAEPFLVASSLNLVMAQRLCRKICEHCKTSNELPPEVIAEIQQEIKFMPSQEKHELYNKKFTFYKGRGCNACNQTGYTGRIGIFELLPVDDQMKQLIIKKAPANQIAKTAISKGMLTLKQDGIKKVLEGITTIEEIFRATKE